MKNMISIMTVALGLVFGGVVASDGGTQHDVTSINSHQTYRSHAYSYEAFPYQTYATQANVGNGNLVDQSYSGTFTSSAPIINAQPINSHQPLRHSTGYSYSGSGSVVPGLAQTKANRAARMRLRGHVGGGLGGAKFEGVGWSNVSRQNAIESCCYWGTRPPAQIGCTRGSDGYWYACVLYH